MKAIKTKYNGILFRSKLEAEWAKFFDAIDIPYIYEPEGFEFEDGTRYLPDFYLPEADQWFEVKGIMNDIDKHKIEMLGIESEKDVIVGYSDGKTEMYDVGWIESGEAEWDVPFINSCPCCEKKCFITSWGSYRCRCCGAHDGNHYLNPILHDWGENGVIREKWLSLAKIDVRSPNSDNLSRYEIISRYPEKIPF